MSVEVRRRPLNRRGFLALCAGCAVAGLAGDTSPPVIDTVGSALKYDGPSLTLTYWNGFTAADGKIMAALVREFNNSQVAITVDTRTYPWGSFYPNLRALSKRRLAPDVGVIQADHLATEASLGLLAPLDGIAEALGLRRSEFLTQAWDLGVHQGVRYGIPLDVHCLAMFYNQEHFAKAGIVVPPTEAVGFDEACRRLQLAGFRRPSWMPNDWPAVQIFLGLLGQYGGQPYDPDAGRATYDSPAGVEALTWMADQVTKGYSPRTVVGDQHWRSFTAAGRRNSIELNGIWLIGSHDLQGLRYGVLPLPTIGDQPASWANSHQLFVSPRTTGDRHRLQASTVFLDFLSRQSSAWAAAGMIPARNSERGVNMYRASRQHVLNDHLASLQFLPSLPGLPAVTTATLGVAVRAAVGGRVAPRDALERAAAAATRLLAATKR